MHLLGLFLPILLTVGHEYDPVEDESLGDKEWREFLKVEFHNMNRKIQELINEVQQIKERNLSEEITEDYWLNQLSSKPQPLEAQQSTPLPTYSE